MKTNPKVKLPFGPAPEMSADDALQHVDWVYFYLGRVYLTIRKRYERYQNPHFENKWWHCLDEWFVFFGFAPKVHGWFSAESLYYDGHKARSVSFFGIVLGCGYSYDAQQMEIQP